MNDPNPFVLVPALIALQFVAFGWRIAREVALGDEGRRTWLFASDIVNLISLIAVVVTCVVVPLKTGKFPVVSRSILGAAYTFMCFTPAIIAGHYRLFSREGRAVYHDRPDYPWIADQEAFFLVIALVAAAAAGYTIAQSSG